MTDIFYIDIYTVVHLGVGILGVDILGGTQNPEGIVIGYIPRS